MFAMFVLVGICFCVYLSFLDISCLVGSLISDAHGKTVRYDKEFYDSNALALVFTVLGLFFSVFAIPGAYFMIKAMDYDVNSRKKWLYFAIPAIISVGFVIAVAVCVFLMWMNGVPMQDDFLYNPDVYVALGGIVNAM